MIFRKLVSAASSATLPMAPALAAQSESNSRAVAYADLDLASAAGLKALHRRIARATEAVCGSYEGADSAASSLDSDRIGRCRAAAKARADVQITAIVTAGTQVASAH